MAGYTERLKDVYIANGRQYAGIGLDRYQIFDEAHRSVLNHKVLNYFWNEEIGHETESMFIHSMRNRMDIIMPYYNDLFKTSGLDYDPLAEIDMVTEQSGEVVNTGDSESKVTASGESESSDEATSQATGEGQNYTYPQQQVNSDGKYATSGSDSGSTSNSSNENSSTQSSTSDTTGKTSNNVDTQSTSRQKGRARSAASLIAEQRNLIVNIDQMIIVDLEDLFMATWTTGNALASGYDYHGRYSFGRFGY